MYLKIILTAYFFVTVVCGQHDSDEIIFELDTPNSQKSQALSSSDNYGSII